MPVKIGQNIGQFEIKSVLGKGGMGEVYLGFDPGLHREVAIKVIHPDRVSDPAVLERFYQEGRTLASLSHPNIVQVYALGEQDGYYYIAMEYIDGKPLNEIINSRGFGLNEAVKVFKQIAEGLKAAHEKGIIHRDIKPQNIILNKDGIAKVLDFGIAKAFDEKQEHSLTQTGHFVGTFSYTAPEVAVGGTVSYQSDIFSLGTLFYLMLTGDHPFYEDSVYQTMKNIESKPVVFDDYLLDILPGPLMDIVVRMTEKSVKSRYDNLDQVLSDLEVVEFDEVFNNFVRIKRPEAQISNEESIRLKLLSEGFETREIGIIISMAACNEEVNEDQADPDKTIAVGEPQSLKISKEALARAIQEFKDIKSRFPRNTSFIASIKRHPGKFASLAMGTMLVFAILFGGKRVSDDKVVVVNQPVIQPDSNPHTDEDTKPIEVTQHTQQVDRQPTNTVTSTNKDVNQVDPNLQENGNPVGEKVVVAQNKVAIAPKVELPAKYSKLRVVSYQSIDGKMISIAREPGADESDYLIYFEGFGSDWDGKTLKHSYKRSWENRWTYILKSGGGTYESVLFRGDKVLIEGSNRDQVYVHVKGSAGNPHKLHLVPAKLSGDQLMRALSK